LEAFDLLSGAKLLRTPVGGIRADEARDVAMRDEGVQHRPRYRSGGGRLAPRHVAIVGAAKRLGGLVGIDEYAQVAANGTGRFLGLQSAVEN
jgi:hypothetical protein